MGLINFEAQTGPIDVDDLDENFDWVNDKMVYAGDYGTLAGDGTTDDYATIQAALNNAPNGSIVYLPPTATGYRVSQTIVIPADKTLCGATMASNGTITSATLIGDLTLTPVVRMERVTSVNGGLVNIGISRAAGAVSTSYVGLHLDESYYPKLSNVRIFRQGIGIHCEESVVAMFSLVRICAVTDCHVYIDGAVQSRFDRCVFGDANDVACTAYVKFTGTVGFPSDTTCFVNCQFNHGAGGGLAQYWMYFDNFLGGSHISFDSCYVEMCEYLFGQTGTTVVQRLSIVNTPLNPNTGWADGTIPSGFFQEFALHGASWVLGNVTLTGMVRSNITGNNFLGNLTISGGSGSVTGNAINGVLTVTGACVGLTVAGNALTGASGTINTATGQVSVYGNSAASAANQKISPSRFEKASVKTLATDRTAVAYSASMTPDASDATRFVITPNNGVAFTINAPTNLSSEQEIEIVITNSTGGALGAVTWNAIFKMAAWTNPATGFHRGIRFWYDGTFLYEISRNTADIPN